MTRKLSPLLVIAILAWVGASPGSLAAQSGASPSVDASRDLLHWPVLPGNERYAAIDGRHLHQYVVEQAEISRRYRDAGNHHWWGRLMGTSADEESQRWFLEKFREIGLTNVYAQPLDLAPKWFPEPWDVTVTAAGRTLTLTSAMAGYRSPATPSQGLDLELVNGGLGSEADFLGRDVRGKAVLLFDTPGLGTAAGATRRAEEKGAAALIVVHALPGNLRRAYTSGNGVPNFSVGRRDGEMLRGLLDDAVGGAPVRVHLRLQAGERTGLKSAIVWGTLEGAGNTDERIYVLAHRDGWFDAAVDNGSGIACMVGLAEYFASVPQAQRRRDIVFLATDGHHAPGPRTAEDPTGEGGEGEGRTWFRLMGELGRNDMVDKTALFINCEHPANLQTYVAGASLEPSTGWVAQNWYGGGPSRPELQAVVAQALTDFGVVAKAQPTGVKPPAGELGFFYHIVPGVTWMGQSHEFHTEQDTPDKVPWTALEASTRAFAKIIDEVNRRFEVADLRRPREARPDELVAEAIERGLAQPGTPAGRTRWAPATGSPPSAAAGGPAPDLLRWPTLPGNEAYDAIDGRRLHRLVVEQSEISRRYRDQGNQHWWGRIVGTSSDEESIQWVLEKFRAAGLSDVHAQPLDLAPKWFPEPWTATVTAGGRTQTLTSAYAALRSPSTPPGGLDVELVYVGLGSEAEYAGRDVRGKAVLIFEPYDLGAAPGATGRAERAGAAAILTVHGLPGNLQQQNTSGNNVPNFSLGTEDGEMLRGMIASAPAGQPVRVQLRLQGREVPNLRSAIVWGTLPGATDETIYIIGHREGWFDAAVDNGSGIATMIGLAEFFAKRPQSERRRTIVFLATEGHHAPGERSAFDPGGEGGRGEGRTWLRVQGELGLSGMYDKTALFINTEHTSTLLTYVEGNQLNRSNGIVAARWYGGGPHRPGLEATIRRAFGEFGVPLHSKTEGNEPPGGELRFFWHMAPGMTTMSHYHEFHTQEDTPDKVSWTGLEATTRAYAKIVDEVNKIDLADLARPMESRPDDEMHPDAIQRALSQPEHPYRPPTN